MKYIVEFEIETDAPVSFDELRKVIEPALNGSLYGFERITGLMESTSIMARSPDDCCCRDCKHFDSFDFCTSSGRYVSKHDTCDNFNPAAPTAKGVNE